MKQNRVGELRAICLAIVAAALAQDASAQEYKDGKNPIGWQREMWFRTLSSADEDEKKGGSDMQAAAFVGREDLIAPPKECAALPGDPIAAIVERARSTNIVIINEAHDAPRHRHFIGEVLEALTREGYTTYAAEAFANYGVSLDHPGVTTNDGFYTLEPIFARTLTLAKSLGYRLVPYEQTRAQNKENDPTPIATREQAQSDNLMAAIFRDRPAEKVIIHVGYMHALERAKDMGWVKETWMAERLAAATGRNPLTINQSDCSSGSASTSIVAGPHTGFDLFIGQPKPTFTDGRPDWRRAIGDIATPVPADLLPKTGAVMIEARLADETLDIVPTDRLLLRPGEQFPLLLPPGRYRLDAFTPDALLNTAPVLVDVR